MNRISCTEVGSWKYYLFGAGYLTKKRIESFPKEAKTARFCSLNEDGTIHAGPVWFGYENGRIVILTPGRSRKARNVKLKRNVTILIDTEKPAGGVLIYGAAELDSNFELKPTAVSIGEKYMSRDQAEEYVASGAFPMTANWVRITVKPQRMTSFDFSQTIHIKLLKRDLDGIRDG